MPDVRYVVSIVLLLVNGLWKIIRPGCSFESLEEEYQSLSQQVMTKLFSWTLERMDAEILKTRDKVRYECVRFEEHTGIAIFGEFTINRRLYRDRATGEYHFLLDEALGWLPGQRLSPKMRQAALDLATEVPFRRASTIISRFVPGISAMSVWRMTKEAGQVAESQGEDIRREVYEDGVIPEGRHEAGVLMIEADGVMISQQRSKNKKAEVKLLTAYDGKKTIAKDRRSLAHRYSVAAARDSDSFWEESSACILHQWKLDRIEKVELGGDGAAWVKQGSEIFPSAVYHLDRFHIRKNLTEALAFSATGYQAAARAIEQKDRNTLAGVLDRTAKASSGPRKARIKKLKAYLLDNWDGITSKLPEGGLGVIEGQVRHTIARRMKRIGARWSPQGTDRMARLLAAKANGELEGYLAGKAPHGSTLARLAGEAPIKRRACSVEDTQSWLQAHVPSLDTSYLTGDLIRKVIKEVSIVA